ncbi:dynein regulatory complex subunit 7-like [Linepithema humile]|uniref:dynein regulatory complex subunit 7-like n=1 Tax=Linepithema humile TaxID=83485 RepID=UPI00351EAA28
MMNRAGGRKFDDSTKASMKDENAKSVSASLTVTRFEKILRQVQRELCLIKLCWTDIPRMTEDLYLRSLPDTYKCVSNKERLLLWYAENFRRQFHVKYASRRPLLMACENECDIQKFVSTSIRRSTLPYPQLHKWHGCAKFISDYIDYQPPDEVFNMVSDNVLIKKDLK